MSNKTGDSSQILSLPQGGGALRGLGETFSPDLHTGTGNFTVPIALPPGRHGFQPHVSLTYSTGNGNGPCGLGWGVGIPGIARKSSDGVPVFDDTKDTFILSGVEDLVPVETTGTTTRCRPRTEGLFARILHHRDAQHDYWEVRTKDGLVSLYGTPGGAAHDPAVVADPANRSKVFAWKLTQTTDPFGNRIEYDYLRDIGQEDSHHWDQLYLKRIRYVDYQKGSVTKFLVSVTFEYEDRPDPFSDYRAGFEIRTRKRCTRIDVRTHADEERLVRSHHLVYLDEREGMEAHLPLNRVSLLSQVTVVGHDGDHTEDLPPLECGYTRFEPERRDFFPLEGHLPDRSLADPHLALADLFGNGLPDILEMNGTVRYWRNLGDGRFDLPRQMPEAPAGLALAQAGVQLIDANGDGRTDLLVTTETLAGYYPLRFGGLWDHRSFQRYAKSPSFDLEDPEVRLVDLNGDGVTDAIRSGSRLECFFNDPTEGWNGTKWVERQALEAFPNVNFSDPRVKLADMTGDGLQDIVLVYDGNVEYWPNVGHGNWGRRIHMENSPRFSYGYDPRRILLGDVDGDGVADLVYIDHGKVILWINRSGNGWSEPIEIDGTPPVTDQDDVRLTDLLGSGISGVLWSREANGITHQQMFFLDFTGGLKPYLLNEMDNHLGAVTRVEYAPSTRFYLDDEQRPQTRWKTPLPFPVQVVARVEVVDAISGGKLTTEYRCHDGYWDGAEREFRGFGRVDQCDTETFERYHSPGLHPEQPFDAVEQKTFSPPLETRTWFHQGPIGDEFGEWEETDFNQEFWAGDPNVLERPSDMQQMLKALPRRARRDALRAMRGSILRTELYALDGTERQDRPYAVTEHLYGVREEEPPTPGDEDRLRIFFPHALAQRTTQWERGDDPMTQCTFTDEYDEFGQSRRATAIACPRGWKGMDHQPGESYLATRTRIVFAQPTHAEVYIHDRVAKTTTFEIEHSGGQAVIALSDTPDDSASLKLIGQTLNFYDGLAFQGLPFGWLGGYGALVRAEALVLTEEILHEAYKSGGTLLSPPEAPPYLDQSGNPAWTTDYPQEFYDLIPALAGYLYHTGGPSSPYATGYFVATVRHRYDVHDGPGRGLLTATRNPLGRDTAVEHDPYQLLPVKVIDPAGLVTHATYDYRVLQPSVVTDPNGNRTGFTFTPLGLLKSTAVLGKEGEPIGDTPDTPGTRLQYDLGAFMDKGQPISVRTIRRVHHTHDTKVPLPERDETIETVEYSDGFGRSVQTRTQAEDVTFGDPTFGNGALPADHTDHAGTKADVIGKLRAEDDPPNVVVSGWQAYDNKGQVIEKHEPFFSTGWAYAPPEDAQLGQKTTVFFDPRGQVIRTVNPDRSELRVVYGIPLDLGNPVQVTPTPWEAYTYNTSDNAGRTHGTGDSAHWNTPTSIEIDALARTIKSVERNGSDPAVDWHSTHSTYDIHGNLLTVTDALGRVAFRHVYDLANNRLRIERVDAGVRRILLDAAGNEIERRNGKGAVVLQAYDALDRPVRRWARDASGEALTLRERLLYGDGPDSALTPSQALSSNLLGRLVQHYDEAGVLTFKTYDFKGNVLETVRQVVSDAKMLSAFDPPPPSWEARAFRVDWQPPEGVALEEHASEALDATAYGTSFTYDALNRVNTMRYPRDVDGERKALRPRYNRAGTLARIELNGIPSVAHIAYNAKGQRTLIAYGNGVMTRYAYDAKIFRLARLRSERYLATDDSTYHPSGSVLQDLTYEYDLIGNLVALHDRAPGSGIPNTALGIDALDRAFTYDPLSRLLSATGREHATAPPDPPWVDVVASQDPTLTRAYTQQYAYDPVGNLTQLKHQANGGDFVRHFARVPSNNRLATMTTGQDVFDYAYDANGNVTRETTSRRFEWDHSDRMKAFRIQAGASEPSVHAQYLYDAGGRRVKQLVRKQGGKIEVTIDIDGLFEHHRLIQGGTMREHHTLHVMDNQRRIATVRVGAPFPDDATPAVQFHLGDHVESSHVVIDEAGHFINREEYTPYGETSFGGFARKRYRFTGKERDEESGLYYHGARYYAPWLGRWTSCDPAESHLNLYAYVEARPLVSIDPSGAQSVFTPATPHDAVAREEGRRHLERRIQSGDIVTLDPKQVAWRNVAVAAAIYSEAESIEGWSLEHQSDQNIPADAVEEMRWAERDAILEQGEALMDYRLEGDPEYELHRNLASVAYAIQTVRGMGYALTTDPQNPVEELPPTIQEAGAPRIPVLRPRTPQGRRGLGEYRRVGGHHAHAKAAFTGHPTYDPRKGFAISQKYMKQRGWSHRKMTAEQRRLFRGLEKSGQPNTLRAHSDIARKALVAGGATKAEAAALVRESLANLRAQLVKHPTRIPWAKAK